MFIKGNLLLFLDLDLDLDLFHLLLTCDVNNLDGLPPPTPPPPLPPPPLPPPPTTPPLQSTTPLPLCSLLDLLHRPSSIDLPHVLDLHLLVLVLLALTCEVYCLDVAVLDVAEEVAPVDGIKGQPDDVLHVVSVRHVGVRRVRLVARRALGQVHGHYACYRREGNKLIVVCREIKRENEQEWK